MPSNLPMREAELLADERVRAGHASGLLHASGGAGRERDAAPGGEALHEHAPAAPAAVRAADDGVFQLDDDVVALGRAVPERDAERVVALAEHDALGRGRDERARDAEALALAEEVLGVVELEGEPEHVGDGGERDVALAPVEADVELAVVALEDLALGRDRARVGARAGLGERERRDGLARGQLGQPVVLLLLRAEVAQELGRAERVGHHHGDAERAGRAGDLRDDGAVEAGREPVAAVLLRDDEAEEAVVLELLPDLWREVAALPRLPVVRHRAELLDGAVEERLLLWREAGVGLRQKPLGVGLAREELALDPDRPGVDGLLLGGRDGGEELHGLHRLHDGARERAADRRDEEDGREDDEDDDEPDGRAEADEGDEAGGGPDRQRRAGEAEREEHQRGRRGRRPRRA